jgi:hypothetical protein
MMKNGENDDEDDDENDDDENDDDEDDDDSLFCTAQKLQIMDFVHGECCALFQVCLRPWRCNDRLSLQCRRGRVKCIGTHFLQHP